LYDGTSNNKLGLSSTLTLVSTTCTLSTNNVTVTLPKISTSTLGNVAGTTAGRTPFTLALSGCANVGSAYAARATWAFAEGATADTIANSAASPASNVYVQLLDSAMNPISNGDSTAIATVVAAGAYQTQHYAQYVSGGVAGAGMVQGIATLSLYYE
jgi:major type 1 subunit fimbrin (pilin)